MPIRKRYRVVVTIPDYYQIIVYAPTAYDAKVSGVKKLRDDHSGWASRAGYFEQIDNAKAYHEED